MSEDMNYMKNIYDNRSEKLKIVGIVTPNSDFTMGTGILYLPSLITHIIEKSENSEIVKKQLANPTIDVFSNTKFGDNGNDFNFEFSDLVSVDSAALKKAFGADIDQNAVKAKSQDYITEISDDITADITPVKNALTTKLDSLFVDFSNQSPAMILAGDCSGTDPLPCIDKFIGEQNFDDFEEKYLVPAQAFRETYSNLLKLKIGAQDEMIEQILQGLSVKITEAVMQKEILTKVGGLTAYLTNTFSSAFHVDESAIVGAFKLNFTEEELSRVVTAMFTKKQSTLSTNLALMGYQPIDDPMQLSFYFTSFDGKTHFMEFLDNYNENMKSLHQDDKAIDYTDTTGVLMSSVKTIVDAVSYVLIAFVSISLVVSSIMIGIITYISVYERTKEIGILRAIGASKRNISNIFNAETFIVGLLSGIFGIVITYLAIPIINLVLHQFIGDIPLYAELQPISAIILIGLSIVLTLIGGLIPAKAASKKDPVEALRSE
jgi:ABC-type antimicrobial peptide transport system permease subunit